MNVIIGDNGVGKSSLLECMMKPEKYGAKVDYDEGDEFSFFDFEKMNPRISDPNTGKQDLYMQTVMSRFISHGECNQKLLTNLKEFKTNILFLDEPDAALFYTKKLELIKQLKEVAETKQIFVVTHSAEFFNVGNTIYLQGKKKVAYFTGNLILEDLV